MRSYRGSMSAQLRGRLTNEFLSQKALTVPEDDIHQDPHIDTSANKFFTLNKNERKSSTRVSLSNSLSDVSEELQKSHPDIGRVTKWAIGFEKLLDDPIGLDIFTEFLKKEFSQENIEFWVKCEDFKTISDAIQMKQEAKDIWKTYLDTSANCQINVDSKARSNCKEFLDTPNSSMFETAQSQIFTLMKYDSYSRFLKSQMYKDCIVYEMEGKQMSRLVASMTNANPLPFNPGSLTALTTDNNLASNSTSGESSRTKDKKRSTMLIPWTKGKDKKAQDSNSNHNNSNTIPKSSTMKTPIQINRVQSQNSTEKNIFNYEPARSPTTSDHIPILLTDSKYCRVFCNNDGSSTVIQVQNNSQTVYQALSKLFVKKQMPWYKFDYYYVNDRQCIDPQSPAMQLCSKEICLEERCLFVLSLIPIAINLCVKANMKKPIQTILQPILELYQIDTINCVIYLNSASNKGLLNTNDTCLTIDSQNVLVVHKHQYNLLSQSEINNLMGVSLNDLIPSTSGFHFDDYGILKQNVQHRAKVNLFGVRSARLHSSSVGDNQGQMNVQTHSETNVSRQADHLSLYTINEVTEDPSSLAFEPNDYETLSFSFDAEELKTPAKLKILCNDNSNKTGSMDHSAISYSRLTTPLKPKSLCCSSDYA